MAKVKALPKTDDGTIARDKPATSEGYSKS